MVQETWQNQGRQRHGWWGHGASPHDDKPDGSEAKASDTSGQRASASADDGAPRRADRDRIARLVKAAAATAPPAMGVGAISLAAELTGGAAVGSVAIIPVAAVALLLAAGWGLYELMPEYDPRLIHEVKLFGHPGIAAVMDETQDKVAFAVPGAPGEPASVVIWKVETLPPSPFAEGLSPPMIVDQRGKVMGIYLSGTILLNAAGDKALEEAASQGGGQIAPRDDEERRLVDGWKAAGKTPLEVQILLDSHQNSEGGAGAEQDKGKAERDSRNKGLPEQLWTRKGYREAAIANDKPLAEAIKDGKVSGDGVQVHHVIPQASVKKDPDLFLAGGWSPDRLDNLVVLPKDPTTQQKIKDAINETRPTHNGSHKDWGKEVDEEIENMKKDLRERNLRPENPDYGRAVSDGLSKLLQKLRTGLMTKDKVSMLDQPHEGAA